MLFIKISLLLILHFYIYCNLRQSIFV